MLQANIKKKILSGLLIFTLTIAGNLFVPAENAIAANVSEIIELKENEELEIQLDGKGKKERIRYNLTWGLLDTTLDIYINDEIIESLDISEHDVRIYIMDVNSADKFKDIMIVTSDDEEITSILYCQYKKDEFIVKQDIKEYLDSGVLDGVTPRKGKKALMHLLHTKGGGIYTWGKKELDVIVCAQSNQLGCFHFQYPLKLKKGKFVRSSNEPIGYINDCDIKEWVEDPETGYFLPIYKVTSKCTFYTKPGERERAFTLKEGTQLEHLYCKYVGGKLYIGVDYQGKTGWIEDSQRIVFKQNELVHQ